MTAQGSPKAKRAEAFWTDSAIPLSSSNRWDEIDLNRAHISHIDGRANPISDKIWKAFVSIVASENIAR